MLNCPRCRAYVQPDWSSCKICGFDPAFEGTYESIYRPRTKPLRPGFSQTIGALVTLVAIIGLGFLSATFIYNRFEHRDDSQLRQQIVSIDR